jgi:hypothetical protein
MAVPVQGRIPELSGFVFLIVSNTLIRNGLLDQSPPADPRIPAVLSFKAPGIDKIGASE